jgi:hypothetical protein
VNDHTPRIISEYQKHKFLPKAYHRAGECSGKFLQSYYRGSPLESRSGYWISRLLATFSSVAPSKCRHICSVNARLFTSKSLQIHYILGVVSFNAIESELLAAA